MILSSESPAAGAVQTLLAFSPTFLQTLADALSLYRKNVVENSTSHDEVRFVNAICHRE